MIRAGKSNAISLGVAPVMLDFIASRLYITKQL
jgi:hypothetical protein